MKTINKKVMYIIAVCVLIACVVAGIFGIKYLLIGNISFLTIRLSKEFL